MSSPRIAIISPNRNAWSETFVRAHIEGIPGVVMVLEDGFLPRRSGGKDLISNTFGRRAWRKVIFRSPEDDLRNAIVKELRNESIDVVLAEYGPTGDAMLSICQEAGVPLVVHFHGVDAFHKDLLKKHNYYQQLLRDSAGMLVVSREMEQQLVRLGANRQKIVYNVCGVDTQRFVQGATARASKVFLFVGRFVEKKAPHLVVLSFLKALQVDPTIKLIMFGDGPLHEAVRQIVLAYDLEDAVELRGIKPPDEIGEAMRDARALVQHSVTTDQGDREGTPVAVMEALASGLPVVATKHAGISDIVEHGVSGFLVEEFDIDNMAAHLLQLASDPELAARMGGSGRAFAEEHLDLTERIGTIHDLLVRVAGR